jgi:hypothetical protein
MASRPGVAQRVQKASGSAAGRRPAARADLGARHATSGVGGRVSSSVLGIAQGSSGNQFSKVAVKRG